MKLLRDPATGEHVEGRYIRRKRTVIIRAEAARARRRFLLMTALLLMVGIPGSLLVKQVHAMVQEHFRNHQVNEKAMEAYKARSHLQFPDETADARPADSTPSASKIP